MSLDFDAMKQGQRAMWSAGDYPDLATHIESVSHELVARMGIGEGATHLDVATGTGNLALEAARRRAAVTGLDLTPDLLAVARRRAEAEGLAVEFLEGDAEALPFADASFDHVTSVFGVIFAPRHEVAAAELVRVVRPGGTVGFTAWTPEGANGQMFATVGKHMPPPPPGFQSPVQWGSEEHVRGLFEPLGVELELERRSVIFADESPAAWLAYNERTLGPMVLARAALQVEGRWDALHADMLELYERFNDATDGTFRAPGEYLMVVARRP